MEEEGSHDSSEGITTTIIMSKDADFSSSHALNSFYLFVHFLPFPLFRMIETDIKYIPCFHSALHRLCDKTSPNGI